MKPIKDETIDKIVQSKKDYTIHTTIKDIYTKFECKKQEEPSNVIIEPKKLIKRKTVGSLFGIGACLATSAVACLIAFGIRKDQVIRTNISNDLTFLSKEDNSKVLAKEFLLFNLTRKQETPILLDKLQSKLNPMKAEVQKSDYDIIVDGFEKIAPIIFNKISSFDSMKPVVTKLDNPFKFKVSEDKYETFENKITSKYSTLEMNYYLSNNKKLDYGIYQIKDHFFKTYIYTVDEYKNDSIEVYLEGLNKKTYFKISEENYKNVFTYREFENKEAVKNNHHSHYYNVKLGSLNKKSEFRFKNIGKYEIYYHDIDLKDLVKIMFKVDYKKLNTDSPMMNYYGCCSKDNNQNNYIIDTNEIY